MLTHKIKIIFLALIIFTLAAVYIVTKCSNTRDSILPGKQSLYPWRAFPTTDSEYGGGSSIDVKDSAYNINFDFNLTSAIQYPYVTFALIFKDDSNVNVLEDWSSYSSIELRVKCRPDNILHLTLFTHDEQVTKSSVDINDFRPSLAFFSCGEEWKTVRVDLSRLETAVWWLQRHNLNLASREYSLRKVGGVALSTSIQSPIDTPSNVIVQEVVLNGTNRPLIYTLSISLLMLWSMFLGWIGYRLYKSSRTPRVIHDTVPMTYQPLSIEPKYNREKEAVLNYMASEYANPNLNVEMAVSKLGINRFKINEILRNETGLTFSTYLNKLRLTEAARLLSNKQVAVAEAAFAVGYNSLSYFNRLFKKEHGCNPSAYEGPTAEGKSVQNI